MKKKKDNKTAIKLINQYAESYKRVEEENKKIKNEISDYKVNLKPHKDLIDGILNKETIEEKSLFYINKLKEEYSLLIKLSDNSKRDFEEIKTKLIYFEQLTNDTILKYRESTESLTNKIFILENALIKKDNIITRLITKLNNVYEYTESKEKFIEKEYYVNN